VNERYCYFDTASRDEVSDEAQRTSNHYLIADSSTIGSSTIRMNIVSSFSAQLPNYGSAAYASPGRIPKLRRSAARR
jgi:hypothetical protein